MFAVAEISLISIGDLSRAKQGNFLCDLDLRQDYIFGNDLLLIPYTVKIGIVCLHDMSYHRYQRNGKKKCKYKYDIGVL